MRLAQGHNTVTTVRLEPAAHRSRVKPLPSQSTDGTFSHVLQQIERNDKAKLRNVLKGWHTF